MSKKPDCCLKGRAAGQQRMIQKTAAGERTGQEEFVLFVNWHSNALTANTDVL